MEPLLFIISLLVFLGFLLIPLSHRLGAPILLLVLIGGMLVGEDGPGGIPFNNFNTAYTVGSLALAIILFAGGLETDISRLKRARLPAILLATVGVILTAAIVGVPASFIMGVPLEQGLLLGAVVASTDAAATFLLIQHSSARLTARLKNTLILESGLNDPMAIFLTVSLTALVNSGETLSFGSLERFAPTLLLQLGLGTFAGVAGGWGLRKMLDWVSLSPGLYPPMALSGALMIYAGTASFDGSGFLAIYLCGLMLAGGLRRPVERILHFNEGLQWLSQIALFLMLGLLVKPAELVVALPQALTLAAILMFVARPLAVAISTAGLGFNIREKAYLSWVGLRGAVPIFLAILPVISIGPVNVDFFNIVFVIVVASLVFQGWTVGPSARWLGVANAEGEEKANGEKNGKAMPAVGESA
jgi:NhaP-type Na+/H+ and K+/H+ antiporter